MNDQLQLLILFPLFVLMVILYYYAIKRLISLKNPFEIDKNESWEDKIGRMW